MELRFMEIPSRKILVTAFRERVFREETIGCSQKSDNTET